MVIPLPPLNHLRSIWRMDMTRLGNRIKWARKQLGWSAADLVRKSGVKQGTVSKIEQLNQDTMGKYALPLQRALGVSMDWLAEGIGDPYPEEPRAKEWQTINSLDTLNHDTGHDHVSIQSYEMWAGDIETEIRHMTVPAHWLADEGFSSAQIKSICMPDDSMAPMVMRGFEIAVNVRWGGTIKNGLYYALQIGDILTIRLVEHQFNGGLLLRPENSRYADQLVSASAIHRLTIIGEAVRFQGTFPRR